MKSAIFGGVAYTVVVFSIGFVLGTIRVFSLVPALGETGAVLFEVPFMLVISWLVCRWLIRHFRVGHRWVDRVCMGGTAFSLLMIAEFVLALSIFRRTFEEHLATYGEVAGLIGLVGQIFFGAFPVLQLAFEATGPGKQGGD